MFDPEIRILVVDDMFTMRMLVKRALQELGFNNIADAANGAEAWTEIEGAARDGSPFSLILADWAMPKLNGIELVKKLRAEKGLSETPFIILAGESERAQVIAAIQAGVTNYMVKPFTQATLVEKLQAVYAASKRVKAR